MMLKIMAFISISFFAGFALWIVCMLALLARLAMAYLAESEPYGDD